jgi:acyl carrier protein
VIKKVEIEDLVNEVKIGSSSLGDSSNFISDGILDSFSILLFMTELESRHGISISINEDMSIVFTSVQTIYDYINNKTRKKM